jgi:hypothetical protein
MVGVVGDYNSMIVTYLIGEVPTLPNGYIIIKCVTIHHCILNYFLMQKV